MDKLKAGDQAINSTDAGHEGASQKFHDEVNQMGAPRAANKQVQKRPAPEVPDNASAVVPGKDGLPTVHIFDKAPTIEELRRILTPEKK